MYEGRTLNDKNERLPCYPKRAKCYMKPYFPGVPRHWERLEHWDSLSSRSLHASRLFQLNHLLSSYALFVIARLLRGQKEKERGRKVTDDKNSAETTKKKVISTWRYTRPFCRDLRGYVWDGFTFSCSLKPLSKQN